MKFLVIGCGSIGKRHTGNLISLGQEVEVFDTDESRLLEMQEEFGIRTYSDLENALATERDAALICTPSASHILPALAAVKSNHHLFIEKPLSDNLEGVDELLELARRKQRVILVGCNMRFHQGILEIKNLLNQGAIGNVVGVRVQVGQYLPDWHPWQDYRESYSASRSLGGGIVLDGIHELDYIRWLLGEVREVFSFCGKLSNLEIDTEDTAEILLRFENNVIGEVHLDYIQRVYQRSCQVIGEEGTIVWDYTEGMVKCYSSQTKKWQDFDGGKDEDSNQMYLREMKHFINCLKGKETPMLDGENAKRVLEIAVAAKESSETGKSITLAKINMAI